ncbi:Metallo-dependent hydrolase [Macrolepiota fuliginosa MF-IS2]|uniref:Metallo-dependent hydrolase n=1 Tax=Macrolepiota fuliginosa MF-IS2 TaxID=1400762 RepID=A0A9P6C1P8_9AGAR|nr:Metallo-dependent hydrolase [Macrolepiota fuliginosa MF-IS2]
MSSSFSIFYGGVVTPVDASHWKAMPRCLLAVDPSGNVAWLIEHLEENTIPEVLNQKGRSTVDVVILRKGEFIVPGFIDTHTHAAQFPNLGVGGQYELLDWLNKVTFPKEAQFKDAEFAREAYRDVVRRSLDYGTTTSCYYATLHLKATTILADATHELGQRAFIGKCNMDRKGESPEYYIEENAKTSLQDTSTLISYIRALSPVSGHGATSEPLVQPILTPRFAISCTSDLLYGVRDLAHKHDEQYPNEPRMRIQTHISENRSEIEYTLKLFPKAKSYADVYDHHGVLGDTTILAHAVHLTGDEIELIKKKNAGISHCPTSNFNLRSGVAPIGKYLDEGMKVGLGTDVSGGYSISMLNAIQSASIASKVIAMNPETPALQTKSSLPGGNNQLASPPFTPPSESASTPNPPISRFANRQLPIQTLFYLATLGGAHVCNLSHRTGSFCPGKGFDALLVSVLDETGAIGVWGKEATLQGDLDMERKKLEENLERFLFCGDDRNIRKVWVQGRFVGGKTFQR